MFLNGLCLLCSEKAAGLWCNGCEADMSRPLQRCPICATESIDNKPCGNCLKIKPAFNRTVVAFRYHYPVNHLIWLFKFKNRPELAKIFGKAISNRIKHLPQQPGLIIPVPLHPKRQVERGFNQSLLLAKQLGRQNNIQIDMGLCRRIKNTSPQRSLTTKERKRNVQGAFILKQKPRTQHVAIVDDVITTGSTTHEIASLLKKAGCQKVDVWALART